MQLAPSLHRIGSSSLVNSYLVVEPQGITVVDTGMAGQWRDLVRELGGHTPGSVAYHVPAVDAVFVGDGMTTRSVLTGVAGPAQAPFTVDRAAALASLAALDPIAATWVLPGHGEPWNGGLAVALERIRASAPAQASGSLRG